MHVDPLESSLSAVIFQYDGEAEVSPLEKDFIPILVRQLQEFHADEDTYEMHCMISTNVKVQHDAAIRYFTIAHSAVGKKHGFVVHELEKLIKSDPPLFHLFTDEQFPQCQLAADMVMFTCQDPMLRQAVQFAIKKMTVPAMKGQVALTPFPKLTGPRSKDITHDEAQVSAGGQTVLHDRNSQQMLALYRACRGFERMLQGKPISKKQGLSCRSFDAYAFQFGILKILFPDGLPFPLQIRIMEIEKAKHASQLGLNHALSLTDNIEELMADFLTAFKICCPEIPKEYLDFLLFDAKSEEPYELMTLINKSRLFSAPQLVAVKDGAVYGMDRPVEPSPKAASMAVMPQSVFFKVKKEIRQNQATLLSLKKLLFTTQESIGHLCDKLEQSQLLEKELDEIRESLDGTKELTFHLSSQIHQYAAKPELIADIKKKVYQNISEFDSFLDKVLSTLDIAPELIALAKEVKQTQMAYRETIDITFAASLSAQ